jgi:hypothetical protein
MQARHVVTMNFVHSLWFCNVLRVKSLPWRTRAPARHAPLLTGTRFRMCDSHVVRHEQGMSIVSHDLRQ